MKIKSYKLYQVPPRWLFLIIKIAHAIVFIGILSIAGALSYIFLVGKVERGKTGNSNLNAQV